MGLPQILDAVATKARSVTGMAGASGSGITAGVDGLPLELPGSPYAMCLPGDSVADQGRVTSSDDEIQVRVYVRASDLPAAGAVLVGFPDLFESTWRTDRDLGGTCLDSWYAGHGPVEREDWAGVAWLVLPIRIGVRRIVTGTLTS